MLEPSENPVEYGLSVFFIDGFGEGNTHRTGPYTVLRVTAIRDPVVAHDPFQPVFAIHLAARMHVEQTHLGDCLRSNVIVAFILRTRFKTATTCHAS